MEALTDLLQTDTTLWAGGAIGIFVGVIVGLPAGLLVGIARRRARKGRDSRRNSRKNRKDSAALPAAQPAGIDAAGPVVRFLDSADTAHDTLRAVDEKALADTELEDALHAQDPVLRRLAEAIMALAAIRNDIRVRADAATVDATETVFTHLTHTAMDGVDTPEQFSDAYQKHKAGLIEAARAGTWV